MRVIVMVAIIAAASVFCGAAIATRLIGSQESEPNQTNNSNQPNQKQEETNPDVPLPSPEYTITLFFKLINEGRIPEATQMMSKNLVPDDSTKQAYGVQFNEIEAIEAVEVSQYEKDNWTSNQKTYKVKIEVTMSSESENAMIPYYGWDTSPIYKWITVTRPDSNSLWQIDQIASGP